jgi:putative membrane protein
VRASSPQFAAQFRFTACYPEVDLTLGESSVVRILRSVSWLFFVATMYLILTEAVWPWLKLPDLGNVGFTLTFVGFSLAHCWALEGAGRTGMFFAVSAVVSYAMEEVGVRTGLIYGPYHYSDMLGVKLGHVPVLIPLAWFMMIYPSWMVARALLHGVEHGSLLGSVLDNTARAAVAACVMTAWDTVMDPGMAAAGNWVWEKGGAYFGVPVQNYFGWLLTTFLVYWIEGFLWRRPNRTSGVTRIFAALPVIVYAFFAVRYVASSRIHALQVVAVFSMGLPALLALLRVAAPEKGNLASQGSEST